MKRDLMLVGLGIGLVLLMGQASKRQEIGRYQLVLAAAELAGIPFVVHITMDTTTGKFVDMGSEPITMYREYTQAQLAVEAKQAEEIKKKYGPNHIP